MASVPGPTVVVWKRKPLLDATELIPALVAYAQKRDAAPVAAAAGGAGLGGHSATAAAARRGSGLAPGLVAAAAPATERHHAVEFLEHCLSRPPAQGAPRSGGADRAIYNYLLLLHAQARDNGAALLRFLDAHLPAVPAAANAAPTAAPPKPR
jgi:hypothetical protein